ncbi:MAG: hypothetical protein IIA67_03815 [Planctomycetes bacterium]|nr:hypothetical protein [Planctomycetota bacterium]
MLATVLVDLAALWPSRAAGDAPPTILAALAGSQLSLAACYLVFGRAYILWRVVTVTLVLGAMSLAAAWAGLQGAPQAFSMGTIYLVIVSGALGVVRWVGGRWTPGEDEVRAGGCALRRRLQFSLDDVFTAVTLICVAMGAAVNFDWRLPQELIVPTVVWSFVMSLLTVGSLSVLLPKRPPVGFVAITWLPGLFVAAMLPLAVTSALAAAMLVLSLVVVRQAGWHPPRQKAATVGRAHVPR